MASEYLYTEEYGQGDPTLCLHGFGASIFTWRHFIEPFSKNRKLILVDLKGFGSSAKPDDRRYSIFDHGDALYELILKNDWRNLTLIGNSYGGALALLLALRLQEDQSARLSRLVLIDAGAYKEYLPGYLKLMRTFLGTAMAFFLPARRTVKFVLNVSYYDKEKISEEQIDAYARPLSDPGNRNALLETARQCIPPDADELVTKYKSITVPTLILWGRHDKVVSLKVGELLSQALPNSRLEIFEECGHIPQEEWPEKTIASISRFLELAPQ